MRKALIFVITIIGFALFIYFNLDQTKAGGNDPGTIADPLVSKSYVDDAQVKLLAEIDEKIKTLSTGGTATGAPIDSTNMAEIYKYIDQKMNAVGAVPAGFVVVQASVGQRVICEGSTEVILRVGNVTVIGNTEGLGIPDITGGQDIKNGLTVALNHLFIVPQTDGRGFLVVKDCYLMIKGKYVIQ